MSDIQCDNSAILEGLEKAFEALEASACKVVVPDSDLKPVIEKPDDDARIQLLEKQVKALNDKVAEKQSDFERILKIKVQYDGIIQKQMRMLESMSQRLKDFGLDYFHV